MVTGFDLIHDNKPLQKHWISRLIAYLLDFLLSSLAVYIIFLPFTLGRDAFWYFPMTAGLMQVFYSAVFEYYSKRTVGKAIMKLEVEQLTQTFDISEALIRNFSKLHGVILVFDWLAGMLSKGDPRQRYLDRLAETTVRGTSEPIHVKEFVEDHLFSSEDFKIEKDKDDEVTMCRICGGKLASIGDERHRCRNCGRIQ